MTLLEDLEAAADHFEAVSRDMPPINPMRADVAARAARLRAHATRLREEMAKAADYCPAHCAEVLTRINGSPPPRGTK